MKTFVEDILSAIVLFGLAREHVNTLFKHIFRKLGRLESLLIS